MALRMIALILSCISAPVMAASLGALAYVAGDQYIETDFRSGWLGVALLGGWMGLVFGVPAMALIGLPLHAYYQRRGSTDIVTYALGGGFTGLLTAIAVILPGWRWPMPDSTVKLVFFGVGMGVVAACLFWFFWRLRRTPPNPPTSTP